MSLNPEALPDQAAAVDAAVPSGTPPRARAGAVAVQRVRVTFTKEEAIRFIGHLDVARLWERALRRAGLPLAYTQGFTPHPRLTFGAPLALGATAGADLVDVYLSQPVEPDAVLQALHGALPPACRAVAAATVPLEGPSLMALVRWAAYQCRVVAQGDADDDPQAEAQGSRWVRRTPEDARTSSDVEAGLLSGTAEPWRPPAQRLPPVPPSLPLPGEAELRRRITGLLQATSRPVQRMRDSKTITVDLRPLIVDLWLEEHRDDTALLGMLLRQDSAGAARPDEVAGALGLRTRRIHRVRLGLEGEAPAAPSA